MARDGMEVGNELWLLADAPDGAGSVILVLGSDDGLAKRRLHIALGAPASAFAVDRDRRQLFLSPLEDATVVRVQLPQI
jgi:hypothetical protein